MSFYRFMEIVGANIVVLGSIIITFFLYIFAVFGLAILISDLPNILTRSILALTAFGGMALLILFNYLLWKWVKNKFRVTEDDIINPD